MHVLQYFGGEEEILVVIDLKAVFPKFLQQLVDNLYVDELALSFPVP